jgi:hypothetical protein
MMSHRRKYQYMDNYPPGIRLGIRFSEIQKFDGLRGTHIRTFDRLR